MIKAYYFSHDCNASEDPKILSMCNVYKAEGYGWYWMLIEQMRQQEGYKLPLSLLSVYAKRFYATPSKFAKFVDDCINKFHLFSQEDLFIFSESLIKRMAHLDEISQKAKESAKIRWGNSPKSTPVSDANAMPTLCEGNAIKEEEIKEEQKKVNTPIVPSPSTTATLEKTQNVFKAFEDNLGILTPMNCDRLKDFVETYPELWILDAFQQAVDHNARNIAYVEKILVRWQSEGRGPPTKHKAPVVSRYKYD